MYSSTMLEAPSKSGCWRQLDYAEEHADSLHALFYWSPLGIAAHAVLQYCAERRTDSEKAIRATAEEVGNLLIQQGRSFRGHDEGPLPADDVWQGVDIAVSYILARGLPLEAETLIAERDWEHPDLPYRALIDLVAVLDEGGEEYERRIVEVADYKTSWQADENELSTLQRWGQAVCVWRALNDPDKPHGLDAIDVIRQRVVNLRTWQEYTRELDLHDEDDVAELEKWEKRIAQLCNIADGIKYTHGPAKILGTRPVNPGVGCLSCMWRHKCDDVWEAFDSGSGADAETIAIDLARVEAQRPLLISALKEVMGDTSIVIPGGEVGFREQPRRVLTPGAEKGLLAEWFASMDEDVPDELLPVLTSLLSSFKLGKGNLDAFAKAVYPERRKGIAQERAEYVESITDEIRFKRFGVWKKDG